MNYFKTPLIILLMIFNTVIINYLIILCPIQTIYFTIINKQLVISQILYWKTLNNIQSYINFDSTTNYDFYENISNNVYKDLHTFNKLSIDTILTSCNINQDILLARNIDISNLIANVENIFIENMISCNLYTSNNTF